MRKAFNKIILVAFVIAACAFLSGCEDVETTAKKSTVGEKQIGGELTCIKGNGIASEWVDEKTGVHYFFTPYGGLTPRFNTDGTLYTEEAEQ